MRTMRFGRHALMMMMMVGAVGCAHRQETGYFQRDRTHVAQVDDFGWLLMRAGLEPDTLPSGQEITVQQAQDLRVWVQFMLLDGHMASYGPRKAVEFLMGEIIAGGVPVTRAALSQQLIRFQYRYVLRPDGYVADALRGRPVRSVGPLRVERGAIMAASLKMGAFYVQEGNYLREDPTLMIHPPPSTGNKLSTAQR